MVREFTPFHEARERKSEDEIIREIVKDAVFQRDPQNPDLMEAMISYGSKSMTIYFREHAGTLGTSIEADRQATRRLDETTLLYRAAHALGRGLANRYGKPLEYTLRTTNEKMIAWAQEKGDIYFNWKDTRTHIEEGQETIYEFIADIDPVVTKRVAEKRSNRPKAA